MNVRKQAGVIGGISGGVAGGVSAGVGGALGLHPLQYVLIAVTVGLLMPIPLTLIFSVVNRDKKERK
jgi:hypothetical protein